MKGERRKSLRFLIVFTAVITLLFHGNSVFAVSSSNIAGLLAEKYPHLDCAGSGETLGAHPGWAKVEFQKITSIHLRNSSYGIYWCPASAPQGQGQISYTLTATLGGLTCETTATSCVINGLNKNPTLSLMATDETGSYRSRVPAIQNSGIPENCLTQSLACNPAPLNIDFPTYGNTYSDGLSNCTFAAVANWERIALGRNLDPSLVTQAFYAAGGTSNRGLTTDQVFNYWKGTGVGGVSLKDSALLPTDPYTLKKVIDDPKIRVVIASLDLAKNQSFAGYSIPRQTYHWVIVDGYTSQGPIVVTWGQTRQMTWQQWNYEAVSIWRVSTDV